MKENKLFRSVVVETVNGKEGIYGKEEFFGPDGKAVYEALRTAASIGRAATNPIFLDDDNEEITFMMRNVVSFRRTFSEE